MENPTPAFSPPPRSQFGLGRNGRPVELIANFLALRFKPLGELALYDVKIKPEGKPPALNRKIWLKFMETISEQTGTQVFAVYDGRSLAFSVLPLPVDDDVEVRFFILTCFIV